MTGSELESVGAGPVEGVPFPLLFASLTGRSGHGLARMRLVCSPIRSASVPRP